MTPGTYAYANLPDPEYRTVFSPIFANAICFIISSSSKLEQYAECKSLCGRTLVSLLPSTHFPSLRPLSNFIIDQLSLFDPREVVARTRGGLEVYSIEHAFTSPRRMCGAREPKNETHFLHSSPN